MTESTDGNECSEGGQHKWYRRDDTNLFKCSKCKGFAMGDDY